MFHCNFLIALLSVWNNLFTYCYIKYSSLIQIIYIQLNNFKYFYPTLIILFNDNHLFQQSYVFSYSYPIVIILKHLFDSEIVWHCSQNWIFNVIFHLICVIVLCPTLQTHSSSTSNFSFHKPWKTFREPFGIMIPG